jgi:hypothetical protein
MWIAGFSIVLSLVVAPSPADAWPCGPDDLSPRAPLYYLNHCERPFADILAEFSRDTGYPITGRMPSGTVTLDCGREVMPFDLALTRLNVVLLSADGSPYLRRNTLNSSLEIRRMVEQCSMSIDFDWIFTSVDKSVQSNAQRSQLVILLYRSRAGQYPTIAPQLELLPSYMRCRSLPGDPNQKALGLMGAAVDIRHYVPLVQMLDETCAHKNQKVSEFQLRFAEPAAVADCIRQAHPEAIRIRPLGEQRLADIQRGHAVLRIWCDWAHRRLVFAGPANTVEHAREIALALDNTAPSPRPCSLP